MGLDGVPGHFPPRGAAPGCGCPQVVWCLGTSAAAALGAVLAWPGLGHPRALGARAGAAHGVVDHMQGHQTVNCHLTEDSPRPDKGYGMYCEPCSSSMAGLEMRSVFLKPEM